MKKGKESQPSTEAPGSITEDGVVGKTKEVTDMPVVRADTFRAIYANYASCATSAQDITMMLGLTVYDDPHECHIEQRVAVFLSPPTAKAIAKMLGRTVENYEAAYGTIRI